jgi:hypothetical protein
MRTPILGPGTFAAGAGSTHRENIVGVFKNADTVTLQPGIPCVLVFNGTDDGLAVVLAATAGAAITTGAVAGVVVSPGGIAVGALGDVQTYGLCLNAKITAATRSATSAAWVSYAAGSTGQILEVETVANGFTPLGTTASQQYAPYAMLAGTYASSTTQASSLAQPYVTAKVFLRLL